MTDSYIQKLIKRRNCAIDEFATLGNMCSGSLVETYRKCGKPNCHCAIEEGKKHGPSYLLNYSVNGKQKSRRIKANQLEQTREQMAEYKRFREISKEFIEASNELSRALHDLDAGGEHQKKTPISTTRSKKRSRGKRRG
ncbi:MAG: hypothetical protein OXK19_03825 [Candidatus Dadabacteria bacterium]|nr:hypothetical protein [Candidatus Dadabacteria bacterium]